jgi:hypothetical protein
MSNPIPDDQLIQQLQNDGLIIQRTNFSDLSDPLLPTTGSNPATNPQDRRRLAEERV